ncbi:MAG: hypothetical protein ACOC2W_00630 [bacterium]
MDNEINRRLLICPDCYTVNKVEKWVEMSNTHIGNCVCPNCEYIQNEKEVIKYTDSMLDNK